MVLIRQGKVAEAFEIADAARGRALLDHLAAARRDIERAPRSAAELLEGDRILREIDALADELRALDSVPPRDRGAPQEATARFLATRLAEVRQRYEDRLAVATASSAPSLLGPPASAAAVMAALRPGEAILEYLVSPSGVHVFVLRPAAVTHTLNPVNREELSSRVRPARELIAHPGADAAFEPVLEALYRDLLAPVVEKGALDGVERLLIVPHGPLVYLPFAALIDDTGEFTLTRFEIAVLPSAASLPALRGSESPGGSPTGVGGLALAPMPDALPATREEASSVRRALGGRALYGRGATERAARQGLGSAPVVHIAAHASLNSANPMFSGIELAPGESAGSDDDGRLEVHELLGLRIASELVFLSGCETGSGSSCYRLRPGRGLRHARAGVSVRRSAKRHCDPLAGR